MAAGTRRLSPVGTLLVGLIVGAVIVGIVLVAYNGFYHSGYGGCSLDSMRFGPWSKESIQELVFWPKPNPSTSVNITKSAFLLKVENLNTTDSRNYQLEPGNGSNGLVLELRNPGLNELIDFGEISAGNHYAFRVVLSIESDDLNVQAYRFFSTSNQAEIAFSVTGKALGAWTFSSPQFSQGTESPARTESYLGNRIVFTLMESGICID